MTDIPDPPGTSRNGTTSQRLFERMTPEQQQDFEDRSFLDYYMDLPNMHDADEPPAFERLFHAQWMRHIKEILGRRPDLIQGKLATWANTQRPFGLIWYTLEKAIRATPTHEVVQLPLVPDALIPALPSEAYLDPELGAHAAPWLDGYIQYSQQWATRSAHAFHEAVGLWMMSTVAARRICIHDRKRIYPNLFIAMIARSTLYGKSTAADLGNEALKQAGCGALVYEGHATPQAFLQDMSGYVDPEYGYVDSAEQERLCQRLAFASQCGWYLNEWGGMLKQMTRSESHMSAFHDLIRSLDDNVDRYTNRTVLRGRESIHQPYLAFLASATPSDLQLFLSPESRWWSDGFWPRFALVAPRLHEPPSDADAPEGLAVMPPDLVAMLHSWHVRLGIPVCTVEQIVDASNRPTNKWRRQVGNWTCTQLGFSAEARHAYRAYGHALLHLVQADKVPEHFASSYGRYAEKALRIAMLLASCADTSDHPTVTLEHWAYAQRVTERWRTMLHEVVEMIEHSQPLSRDERIEQRVLHLLSSQGAQSVRDLRRHVHGASSGDILKALEHLVEAGIIRSVVQGQKTLFYVPGDYEDLDEDAPMESSSLEEE